MLVHEMLDNVLGFVCSVPDPCFKVVGLPRELWDESVEELDLAKELFDLLSSMHRNGVFIITQDSVECLGK